jgi:hypothetical protein
VAVQRTPSEKEHAWRVLYLIMFYAYKRRDVRVAEGARLESVYTGNRIEGSNPSLSANHRNRAQQKLGFVFSEARPNASFETCRRKNKSSEQRERTIEIV